MSFKYLLTAILFHVGLNLACSQGNPFKSFSVNLEWKRTPDTMASELSGRKMYLKFKSAAFDEAEMLPIFTKNINIPNNKLANAKLLRPVYETIKYTGDWGQEKITNEIEFDVQVSKFRGTSVANVSFVPIRKNPISGQFERLLSAEIQIYTVSNNDALSSPKNSTTVSKLNDGQIYKFKITSSGIYKLDYNFLNSLGMDPSTIDPRKIQILGNGSAMLPEIVGSPERTDDLSENAIFVSGENDGSFDNSDYILFYAEGKERWIYENGFFDFKENIYTDEFTYFLKIGSDPGKRISNRASLATSSYSSSTYDALDHFEENKLNLMEKEFALPPSGRLWLGSSFQITRSQNFSFNFPNPINDTVTLKSVLYSRAFNSGTYDISVNNSLLHSGNVASVNNYIYSIYARTLSNTSSFLTTGNSVNVNVQYNNGSSNAEAWLDYLTINARCQLTFNGGQMAFRDSKTLGKGSVLYQISNANNVTVWDVTIPSDIVQQSYNGNGNINFSAPADTLRTFIIFDGTDFLNPTAIGQVANQNLHGITISPNLLIVYHKEFQTAAQRLATHRSSHSNISVLAVDIDQVYNEFSSGNPDVSAIRDFAKMFYDRSSGSDSLKYLLLFGNGSFDYKSNNPSRNRNNNFILAYETAESTDPLKTFTSDDYFALLDDGEGNLGLNSSLDIAVGRIPVSSIGEADAVVNKIISYDTEKETLGDWRNRMTFFADDEDGNLHLNDTENIAQTVANRDTAYNIDKVYLDAYPQVSTAGGSRYPDVNSALLRNIFKGNLLMCYLGHGGADGLAQERVFTTTEINTLDNETKLPLFVTATCSFAPFDDPEYVSAGQLLTLNPTGGAIALLTTVRVVLADANEHLTRNTFNYMFNKVNGRMPTLGEVLMFAKNNSGILSSSNSRKFILLGDPSMTLAYPQHQVVTTAINGNPVSFNDTIGALQFVTIQGEIRDQNGTLKTDFNGTVYPTVFDKRDTILTRGNDPTSYVMAFPLLKKIIFRGRATVTNGKFSFSFYVPKDINYSYGRGKISYYADNGADEDANGSYLDLIIGGTSSNAISDDLGPEVKVYMNNVDFASGGMTDENPILLVKLKDDSGINTVGNGIGHDLTGLLTYIQDENENIYNLNDFYEADLDDFTSGTINFPLQKLPEGKHFIKVKAWDVFNNMGEGETEFIVASNAEMALSQVLNYPNPFTTHTEFMFEHNLPGQELEVLIQIYTVSGKLVKTISQDISSAENDGYRIRGINWDGLDDFGDRLGRGVYVYKVTLRATGPATSGTEVPSIQKNSEYQKLVILK